MIWQNTNEQLSKIFKNGRLPTMVYINKQESERDKVERPLHKHDSVCEIVLVYKGSGTYQLGSRRYAVREGDIIFYNQGDLHEVSSSLDTEIGDFCIGIANLQRINMPPNHLISAQESPVRTSGRFYHTLYSLCEQMYAGDNLNHYSQMSVQLLCASFILTALQIPEPADEPKQQSRDEQFMGRILDYLNANFQENIVLGDLAAALGCSASYISHLFKKSTGTSPIQYVIRRRMGLAQTLLISTDYPATHIATLVGYENTNYFISLFTKVVGMTPLRYRKFYLKELKGVRNQS